MKLSGSHMRG